MTFTVEQALRAQNALRNAANLPAEQFPIEAFVGMISDEIETLRKQGKTDEEITDLINAAMNSNIAASLITQHYASSEDRQRR